MTSTSKNIAVKTPVQTEKDRAEVASKLALIPCASAAAVVAAFSKDSFGETDIRVLIDEVRKQFAKVESGDLHSCESMLVGQANALQSIFVSLARRASKQETLPQYEAFLRLALKAQSQCRATIETLAAIKNPPVIFAKQANISNGHQQINNGAPAPTTRTGENQNPSNELLEVQHGGKKLDSRAKSATSRKDKAMAAVG